MSKINKLFWSFFLICSFALIPNFVFGQSQIENSYSNYLKPIINNLQGSEIIVDQGEIINDNFFRYGEDVKIEGDIMGDVMVMASKTLTINGDIEGDVLAIAETITINGAVKGNIRVAASNITINNTIGKNATLLGGQIDLTEKGQIGWSLAFIAGEINIDNQINGNIYGYGGEININSVIGNNVTLFLDEIGELSIMEDTEIGGKLEYRGEKNATINESAIINGDTIHKLIPESVTNARDYLSRFWIYSKFISLFSLLLIGTLIVSIFTKTSNNIVTELTVNPGQKILWGLLIFLIFPITLIILAITIIGAPLSLIGLGIYLFLSYISTIFIGLLIGDKILNYKKNKTINPVWSMMLGTLIFVILRSIPNIGWFFGFLGVIWFMGTIIILINNVKKNQKTISLKI